MSEIDSMLPPVRVSLICRKCSRKVSLPYSDQQRAHGVECDRCGVPMTCVGVLAGRDPQGGLTIWSDLPEPPSVKTSDQVSVDRRRASSRAKIPA